MNRLRNWLKIKVLTPRNLKYAAVGFGTFVVLNLAVFAFFYHRTYPNTKLDQLSIGSLETSQLPSKLSTMRILPASIQLKHASKALSLVPSELGMHLDKTAITTYAKQHRSWLPIANFITSHRLPRLVWVNEPTFQSSFAQIEANFEQSPESAKIERINGTFIMKPEVKGYKLELASVKRSLIDQLAAGHNSINLPAQELTADQTQASLQSTLESLQAQQNTAITLRYQSKVYKLTPQDIANWFGLADANYALINGNVSASIARIGSSFGIQVKNLAQAVAASKSALASRKALDFTLEAVPPSRKTFSYCVAAKGVDTSYLPALQTKLKATYSDPRGWGLQGDVSFVEVTSGCNFTVWLSAADQVPSFGAICDSTWSCTVRPNVIINFDRWQNASTAWNAVGGNLNDYRSMVINHETGHWLGFGHRHCGGPGQQAPVMQQQSIDLEGCQFNAWPSSTELTDLKSLLGL